MYGCMCWVGRPNGLCFEYGVGVSVKVERVAPVRALIWFYLVNCAVPIACPHCAAITDIRKSCVSRLEMPTETSKSVVYSNESTVS